MSKKKGSIDCEDAFDEQGREGVIDAKMFGSSHSASLHIHSFWLTTGRTGALSLARKNRLSSPCPKLCTPPTMLIGAKLGARPYFLIFVLSFLISLLVALERAKHGSSCEHVLSGACPGSLAILFLTLVAVISRARAVAPRASRSSCRRGGGEPPASAKL